MSINPIYVVALGAAVAGFVQGLSGFAFGLVAMSFWAWALDPRLAATLAIFGALTGQVVGVISVRRGFNPRQLWPFILGGLLGIPLGVMILPVLDMDWFKAFLGILLVLWCPAMLFAGKLPRVAGGRLADGVVGVSGGVMSGLGGFAGALPTLWCVLRGYDKDHQRSVTQNFNLAVLTVTMGTYIARGIVTPAMLPMFAVVAPAMSIPALIGARLYIGMSEAAFRRTVLGLLTASGLAFLASSVPRLIGHFA